MINGDTLARVQKAKARRSHAERKHSAEHDEFGSSVASGGRVNMPPVPATSYDGSFTTARLRDLAKLCGKGGFVVSPRTGNSVATGYAVSVHPERETRIGGFVGWRDLMDFIRENWDLLSHPDAVLSATVDRRTGVKLLNVGTVVRELDRAKLLARMHGRATVVRTADGQVCRVA